MSEVNKQLQAVVFGLLPKKAQLRVLEAGCGSTSHIELNPQWHLTGIDLSERQLAKNTHLQEKVLGNLELHQWRDSNFDLVVCWDVVEHLPNPRLALKNLFDAVGPQGLVVLAFPNYTSIKGWVTKLTPFWVHLFFYRVLIGDKRPSEDMGQFPTYLRRDIQPGRIVDFAKTHGLECCYRLEYEGPVQAYLRQRNWLANAFFTVTGWLGLNNSDAMLVLRKLPR
jgi:SAM-dependent methyltransferase